MSLPNQTPITQQEGNGVAVTFAYGWKLSDAGEMQALIDGVPTVPSAISGIGNDAGGSVTFPTAPADGAKVVLQRNTALARTNTDYQQGGDLFSAVLNRDFDRVWQAIQEIVNGGKASLRALRVPPGESIGDLPARALRRNTIQAYDDEGNPTVSVPVSGSAADVLIQLALTAGSSLVGWILSATDAVSRTVASKLSDMPTVLDFRQSSDIDDTEAVERSLAALGVAHFPWKLTAYTLRRTIRGTTAIQLTQAPGVRIRAAASFAGINVTKNGSPFVLKAMVAIFTGSTINTIAGGRIGENDDSPRVKLNLDCNDTADIGVYAERCPGIEVQASVKNCVDGIILGPYCWAAKVINPKVLAFSGTAVEIGFGANGGEVTSPEIWGYTKEGTYGVVVRGNNNGWKVSKGYIETVKWGVLATEETGAGTIEDVDFEVISKNCVKTLQVGSETRSDGPITVTGCYLDSVEEEIHNTGAHILSRGNRFRDPYALNGSHFYSANAKSIIESEGDRADTTNGAAIPLGYGATNSITLRIVDGAAIKVINKKTTDPSGPSFVNWGLYNYTSNSQPSTLSSSFTFENSRQGGATNVFSARSTWQVNETETQAGPTDVVKYAAGITLSALSGARQLTPLADNTHKLGSASLRWSEVFAGTGTINTSDSREKQQVRELAVAELAVAARLKALIRVFKFNSAVALKGDAARWHVGVLAQDVVAAFAAEGLDANHYGVLCYDEWPADPDNGVEAGSRFGVRYDELWAFIVAVS